MLPFIAADATLASAVHSQTGFSNKPVSLVVPNAPGCAIDILAPLLEQRLHKAWGKRRGQV